MFNSMNAAPSLADIAAVTRNNDGDGIGGNNGWWILIILFALFGGWGRGYGYDNGAGSSGNGVNSNYVLATDFATIERKLDGVNNGLCDGFYAQNTNMLNGFSGLQQTAAQNTAAITAAIENGFNTQNLTNLQNANAIMGGINNLGAQMASCCCEIQRGQDTTNYNLATQTNALQQAINQSSQNIMQNCNANYRQLHDELIAFKMEAKDATIADLTARLSRADLAASQAAQNEYLISQIRPCPVPAFTVPNPYAYSGCCGNNGTCC